MPGDSRIFPILGTEPVGQVSARLPEDEGTAASEPLHLLHLFWGQAHAAMRRARRKGLSRASVQLVAFGEGE